MELTTCPDCGLPAEVLDRFALYSTDGPIEHVKVGCVSKHWFVLPAERLGRAPAPRRTPQHLLRAAPHRRGSN
jgi:hypothetical protein